MGYYQAGDYYMAGGKMPGGGGKLSKLKKLGKHAGKLKGLGKHLKGLKLPGGGGGRRHHRMHVTNVKALRRAMRRVQGFAKLARKTIGFTHRVHMKKHRRR